MSKKLNQSNNNENQTNDGHKNKENDGTITMVLKFNMHCNRCAEKVVKFVGSQHGVKSVTRKENDWKKITVIGNVDPVKLREFLEFKFNRKVKLIPYKQGEYDHKQVNRFPMTTVVMKVSLNCQACTKKIQKLVGETEGFVEMSIDNSNNLVTVKGAMDMNVLAAVLKKKLKRRVEIVQVKSHDRKKGKGSSGDGEGEESGGRGGGGSGRPTVEYFASQDQYTYSQYVNRPEYMFSYMHVTQIFNDENPNACVVM